VVISVPRRARHEARERFHERRRDIRRRALEEFKKQFIRHLRRRFGESLRRMIEEWEETRETLSLLRDIIRGRARVVFTVKHVYFHKKVREFYTYDRLLWELPPEERDIVVTALRQLASGKFVSPKLLEQYPWIRYFLWTYIAYYGKLPCKHMIYAVKVTPVTIHFFKGLKMTYYVLRWSTARDAKADPYLGRTRPVDFYVTFFRYKYDEDVINSLEVCEEGVGDWSESIPAARNDQRQPEFSIPLRRAVLQPHWIKWFFAKIMGKPEVFTTIGHCSCYAILERPSKTLQELRVGYRRLYGARPRHRIKEILYRTGLRI